MSDRNISFKALKLMQDSVVWDNHCCMPNPINGKEDILSELQRYRDSGVNMLMINIGDAEISLENHIGLAAAIRYWVGCNTDDYALVLTVDDIARAKSNNQLAIGFNIEGARVIGEQLSLVSFFYDIGVRWMLIAYNKNNLVGGGCHDDDQGLTEFGQKVMDEMDRVGMVKCCSHTGYKTAMEVFDRSKLPVIFSHSNPRALVDHPRNVPDELMQACAKTDGVMGINGVGLFLGENDTRTNTLLKHIDYAVNLIGPEHVGIGSDFVFDSSAMDEELAEHPGLWPAELGYGPGIKFVQPEQLPELTEAMLKLGYSDDVVRGILGENWLRVAKKVWK